MNATRGFVYPLLALGILACSDGGSTERGHASGSGGSTESTGGSAGESSGTGGSETGGGSTDTGGSSGGTTETGGAGGVGETGGSTGTGGQAGGPIMVGDFSRPKGVLPNGPMPASMVGLDKADWKAGLISPTMDNRHHINQPTVLNGYLVVNGNEQFWIYDMSDPKAPKVLSTYNTPNRCATCGGKGEGEAESHTVSFARYGDSFYEVTTSGKGVDIWNLTDPMNVKHVKSIPLEGINYGDFTDAVWGMYWQGDTIYIGGTNTGLHILDAKDPNNVTFVKKIPTSAFGGVSAGPLYAVGNVLVIVTPKNTAGIATMDISDPLNPVALDAIKPSPNSYIGGFYGHHAFMQMPVRAWDVLTDPTKIATAGSVSADRSEYMSFGDGYMFLGHLRTEAGTGCAPGASKIDVTNTGQMKIVSRIWGRMDNAKNDDQFTIAIGNLLVMGDDQDPYEGWVVGVHDTNPDTKPPAVDTVIPKNGSTGLSVKSRVGISFTDNIEFATVNPASFIVRPVGGAPLAGKWGLEMGVVNFDPDTDLAPKTTYEIVLPQGGITDLVGNGIAQEFKATFTTQ
jgi:hypothetical protein